MMNSLTKRILAITLCFAMLISCTNLSWAAASESVSGSSETVTDGQIIAGAYDFFNNEEIAILSCNALAGNRYDLTYPSDDDGLISVDPATKTVTAVDYTDAGGNLWKPVSGKVTYTDAAGVEQDPVTFEISEGSGTFACPATSYFVYVEYKCSVDTLSANDQKTYANMPLALVQATINFKRLDAIKSSLENVKSIFDGLYLLVEKGYITSTSPDYEAIMYMHDTDIGASDNCSLYNYVLQGNAAASLTRYLYDNGADILNAADVCSCYFDTIADPASDVNALVDRVLGDPDSFDPSVVEAAEYIDLGISVLDGCLENLFAVADDNWDILSLNVLDGGADAADLAALDVAVANGYQIVRKRFVSLVNDHSAKTFDAALCAGTASVSVGVDQYKVNVCVKAEVIDKNSVDTDETVVLPETSTVTLVLDKGVSAADILASIEACGIKADALASWDPDYNIGSENYDCNVSGLPESLESDVTCTVLYTPKSNCTITYSYETETTETVKYGYNLLLPKNSDPSKSYDYTVNGTLYRENSVLRITESIVVTRAEGKAIDKVRVPVTIANSYTYGSQLSAAEKAVLNSFALLEENIWYRTPNQNEELVSVSAGSSRTFTVTAEDFASGLLSGASWKAVEGKVVDSLDNTILTFSISEGQGTFVCDSDFDHVTVVYEIVIEDISSADVQKWIDLPNTLVNELGEQKNAISQLDRYYNKLAMVERSVIGVISSMAESGNYADVTKDAIEDINNNAFNSAGTLYLYDYLTEYRNSGFAYYYESGISEKIIGQVRLLSDNFEILWADPGFQNDLESSSLLSGYRSNLEDVREVLNGALGRAADPANNAPLTSANALIDGNSAYLRTLVSEIENAAGSTSTHTASSSPVMRAEVSAASPERTIVNVTVQINNGNGDVTGSATASRSFINGNALTAADIEALEALVASLEAGLSIDMAHYVRTVEGTLPEAGDTLTGGTCNVTYTWSPKLYTASVAGTDYVQTFYADGTLAIVLPACDVENGAYRYTVGTATYDVSDEAYTLRFTGLSEVDALFDSDGHLTVTRELIDTYNENIISYVNSLNKALADSGLVYYKDGVPCLIGAFIALEDPATGDYSIVFRVAPKRSNSTIATVAESVGVAFARSSFGYIAVNGETLWDGKVYLQSLIDMFLNSEIGFDEVCRVIGDDGDLREITADIPELACYNVVGADAYGNINVNGKNINNVSLLGAKLMTANLTFGSTANDSNAKNVPLYVTIEDFDLSADDLSSLKSGIEKVQQYVNINCNNGVLDTVVKIPDALYPYYVAALTLAGKADKLDINDVDLGGLFKYGADLTKDLFTDPDFTTGTIERTLAMAGVESIDLSRFGNLFSQYVRPLIAKVLTGAEFTGTSTFALRSANATYNGNVSVPIRNTLINKFNLDETTLRLIAEADTSSVGLSADFSVTVNNMNTDYDALVVDYDAAGIRNKVFVTKNLANVLNNASRNTVVVLLSDVTLASDVTVNNRVIIDLNGKTVTGNLNANVSGGTDSAFIVDSNVGTFDCGKVDGSITGNFVITGGEFTADVSAMLKEGYVQKNNVVQNKYYTIQRDGSNVNIVLSADFMSVVRTENARTLIKAMAVDIAADAVGNLYNVAELSIDGNNIYSLSYDDVVSYLDNGIADAIKTVGIEAINSIDTAGVTAFANSILADITDFASLSAAVSSNGNLASYTATVSHWDLDLSVEGNADDNYIKADIAPAAQQKTYTVNVKIDESASASDKQGLIDLLDNLDEITTVNDIYFGLNRIIIRDGSVIPDCEATVDLTLDLTQDPDYAVIIAAALAYNTTGDERDGLVDAINRYLNSGRTVVLKDKIENASTALLIKAIKSIRNVDFADMLNALGVTSSSAASLEGVYDEFLAGAARVISFIGYTGGSTLLGTAETSEYGVYSFQRDNIHDCDVALTIKLFLDDDPTFIIKASATEYVKSVTLDNVYDTIKVVAASNANSYIKFAIGYESGLTFTIDNAEAALVRDTWAYIRFYRPDDTATLVATNANGETKEYKIYVEYQMNYPTYTAIGPGYTVDSVQEAANNVIHVYSKPGVTNATLMLQIPSINTYTCSSELTVVAQGEKTYFRANAIAPTNTYTITITTPAGPTTYTVIYHFRDVLISNIIGGSMVHPGHITVDTNNITIKVSASSPYASFRFVFVNTTTSVTYTNSNLDVVIAPNTNIHWYKFYNDGTGSVFSKFYAYNTATGITAMYNVTVVFED